MDGLTVIPAYLGQLTVSEKIWHIEDHSVVVNPRLKPMTITSITLKIKERKAYFSGAFVERGGFLLGTETSTILPSDAFLEQIMKPICPLQDSNSSVKVEGSIVCNGISRQLSWVELNSSAIMKP